jgi:hypothetical protein
LVGSKYFGTRHWQYSFGTAAAAPAAACGVLAAVGATYRLGKLLDSFFICTIEFDGTQHQTPAFLLYLAVAQPVFAYFWPFFGQFVFFGAKYTGLTRNHNKAY